MVMNANSSSTENIHLTYNAVFHNSKINSAHHIYSNKHMQFKLGSFFWKSLYDKDKSCFFSVNDFFVKEQDKV
jgi:hypothetical protein